MTRRLRTRRKPASESVVLGWSVVAIDLLLILAVLAVALCSGCRRGDIGPAPVPPIVDPEPAPDPDPPRPDPKGDATRYYQKLRALHAEAWDEAGDKVESIGLPAARKLLGQQFQAALEVASEEQRANERDLIQGDDAAAKAKSIWKRRAEEARAF